jgi:hypothetical protein
LNVHGVNDVRQTEIQTAQPLVPEDNAVEFEMATKKLKSHKPSDINQKQAELIQAGGRAIISEIHTLIDSIWNKEELPEEWKESIIVLYLFIRAIKHTVMILKAYHFCQLHIKFYPTFFCYGYLHMQGKLLRIFNVGFCVTGKLLIIYSANVKCLTKNGNTKRQRISHL